MKTKIKPTLDTWFSYPVVQQKISGTKGFKTTYGVKFQGTVIPLPMNPRKKFVEIGVRELIRCFLRN